MSRRALVLSLVLLQTGTLLAGTTAAIEHRPRPASAVVALPEADPVPPRPVPFVHVATTARVRATVPRTTLRPAPAARHRVRHAAVRRTRRVVTTARRSVSFEELVTRAVSRLPGYRTGDAVWSITPNFGHWGIADLYGGVVYLSPRVPTDRVYDVVAHEWSHLLSVKAYGGDVPSALSAMNAWFGGSDIVGSERAADCMARLLGATWTHYTACTDSHWRAGARRLLAREQL